MAGFAIAWGVIILFIRRLGLLRIPYLAGCFTDQDKKPLDENLISHAEYHRLSLEFWHNSVYFAIAFFPLVVLVSLDWFSGFDLAVYVGSIWIGYLSLHFWFLSLLKNENRNVIDFLFSLYYRLSSPFLVLLRLEEETSNLLMGRGLINGLQHRLRKSLIRVSLEQVQKAGEEELEHDEREILRQLEHLFETPVRNVMTPMDRAICIRAGVKVSEALEIASLHRFSRYPVVQEDASLVGIFRANQVSLLSRKELNVLEELDDAIQIQSEKSCYEALELLQRYKRQMGIVTVEGKMIGLVTAEDLVEELVGEIEDEFDQSDIRKLSADTYMVNASIQMGTLKDYFGETFKSGHSQTLNGFLTEHCGRIPAQGTIVSAGNLKFLILECDARRISRVRIQIIKHLDSGT